VTASASPAICHVHDSYSSVTTPLDTDRPPMGVTSLALCLVRQEYCLHVVLNYNRIFRTSTGNEFQLSPATGKAFPLNMCLSA